MLNAELSKDYFSQFLCVTSDAHPSHGHIVGSETWMVWRTLQQSPNLRPEADQAITSLGKQSGIGIVSKCMAEALMHLAMHLNHPERYQVEASMSLYRCSSIKEIGGKICCNRLPSVGDRPLAWLRSVADLQVCVEGSRKMSLREGLGCLPLARAPSHLNGKASNSLLCHNNLPYVQAT